MTMTDLEQRHQRVIDFLFRHYGEHPIPRRSYIEPKEAIVLMAMHGKTAVFADLDFMGYPSRFRNSIEASIRAGLDPSEWEFWHKARLAFLELGGAYQDGEQPAHSE